MELSEAMAQIDKLNLIKPPKLISSHMTDEELARLRFTWVSPEEEELEIAELKARGILKGLWELGNWERAKMSKQIWKYLRSRVEIITSNRESLTGLVTDFVDEMDNDEQDEITILVDSPRPNEPAEISLLDGEISSIRELK